MKRHDDPMFEMFRQGLQNYEATPSPEVYAGVQSQLRKGAFFRFSWYSMNVFYLMAIFGAGLLLALVNNAPQEVANTIQTAQVTPEAAGERNVWTYEAVTASVETEAATTSASPKSKATNRRAVEQFTAAKKEVVKATPDMPEAPAVEPAEEQPVAEAKKECEAMEAAPKMEAKTLPSNWMQSISTPDLSTLMTQMESDSDVLYLTLPVKVKIDEKY